MNLEEKLKTVTDSPGVYLMKDAHGRVIYVGKSSALRHRVRSYFQGLKESPRLQWLVRQIQDFDVIATDSELEALILEANLIKKHRPYFNVRLRDDKRYPLLELTMGEDYPRIRVARRAINRNSRYFGPYTSSQAMRESIKLLRKVFKLRTCKLPMSKAHDRPCLDFYIAQCSAPCTRAVSQDEYRTNAVAACRFLEGHASEVIRSLKGQMGQEAEALQFEKAARLRNIIQALERVLEKQKVVSDKNVDEDYLAVFVDGATACVQVLMVREGKLSEEQHFLLEVHGNEPEGEVLSAFVRQYYGPGKFIPRAVYPVTPLPDQDVVRDWLESLRGAKVTVHVPERGEKRELAQLASKNAEVHLKAATSIARGSHHIIGMEKTDEALEVLQQALGLPTPPWRIECYDISNTSGQQPVASMVVLERGRPRKSDYRKFKIRTKSTPDDFTMMREVLTRRLSARDDKRKFPRLPDLLLVDGGKGQLGVAEEVVAELGLTGTLPIASLAKEEELVFRPGLRDGIRLPMDSEALLMLRRIRDESHRFAITFHRSLRGKKIRHSVLDEVPGIGPTRKKAILRHFGSMNNLLSARPEELAEVPGLSRTRAEQLYVHLHGG